MYLNMIMFFASLAITTVFFYSKVDFINKN